VRETQAVWVLCISQTVLSISKQCVRVLGSIKSDMTRESSISYTGKEVYALLVHASLSQNHRGAQ
jgi:hypothetical protein